MPVKKKVVRKTTSKRVVKKKVVRKKAVPKKLGRKTGVPKHDSKKFSLLEYARRNGGQSPVEFLLDIMNAKNAQGKHMHSAAERKDAAKAAAPYCHPKLRSTEIKGEIIPATFIIMDA